MPPARAADGDRQVALSLSFVLGHHVFEESEGSPKELFRLVTVKHIAGNGLVETRKRFEFGHEVRVFEKSHVENEVGVHGCSVLKSERNDTGNHSRRSARG